MFIAEMFCVECAVVGRLVVGRDLDMDFQGGGVSLAIETSFRVAFPFSAYLCSGSQVGISKNYHSWENRTIPRLSVCNHLTDLVLQEASPGSSSSSSSDGGAMYSLARLCKFAPLYAFRA